MGGRGLALLIAAATIGACVPDLPREIHVDDSFTNDERALASAAIAEANARLGDPLLGRAVIVELAPYHDADGFHFDDFGDDVAVIYAVDPTSPEYAWLAGNQDRAYEGYGTLSDVLVTTRLAPGASAAERAHFQQVVMHELGHFLGLPHASERDAIMYSGPGRLDLSTYTTVDQADFCLVYGC